MTRRFAFLLGNLCGLVVGATLVYVYLSFKAAEVPATFSGARQPVAIPVVYPSPLSVPEPQLLPKGTQRRYFNGQPYYVIPLEGDEVT